MFGVGCAFASAAEVGVDAGGSGPEVDVDSGASAAEVGDDKAASAAEVEAASRTASDSSSGPRFTLQSVYADVDGPPVLLERTDGLEVDHGWNVFATVGDRFRVHDRISASYRVRAGRSARGNRLDVREMMAHLRLGSWTLSAGRGTRRLGRGERGRLLLDDNAAAFDMVELRTNEPVRLPGFMASWGEFGFDVLNGVLPFADEMPHDPRYVSAGKPVARPNLLAMRMTYAPTDWLEVGMTRTALYGGVGRERYDTFGEWWDLLTARNENRSTGDGRGGDQMAAVDLEVSVPWLEGVGPIDEVRGWIEYAGTDVHAGWQGDETHSWFPFVLTDVAVLSGGSVRMGSTTVTVEHVRVHPDWYRHSGYPQGYTNGGSGLGHVVGRSAMSWLGSFEHTIVSAVKLRLNLVRESSNDIPESVPDAADEQLRLGLYGLFGGWYDLKPFIGVRVIDHSGRESMHRPSGKAHTVAIGLRGGFRRGSERTASDALTRHTTFSRLTP